MNNIDDDYHPCISFYVFACGKWNENADVLVEQGHASVMSFFADKLKNKLRCKYM